MEGKELFVIRDAETDEALEILLMDEKDIEKTSDLVAEFDSLDEEEQEEYECGTRGAVEYVRAHGIKFEELTIGGEYSF